MFLGFLLRVWGFLVECRSIPTQYIRFRVPEDLYLVQSRVSYAPL